MNPVAYVGELHKLVDALTLPLSKRLPLACKRGCSGCCQDDLTVFAVEAQIIRQHAPEVLAQPPGPVGACAFLNPAGECRIYAHRPYVCRTQGLPLRWLEQDSAGKVEARDICEKTELDLENRPVEDFWTLGPVEDRLAAAAERFDGGQRVFLRALFGSEEGRA